MNLRLYNAVDFIVVPLVVGIILIILTFVRKRQPLEIQKYFFPAYYLRILGAFSIAFIYEFVYGYGDTFTYFHHTEVISSFFSKSVDGWFQILMNDTQGDNPWIEQCIAKVSDLSYVNTLFFSEQENANVSKIGSVFNIVCFNSYIGISLFFGLFSFLGCWYIFRTFIKIFPGYNKQFAIFCLFLPSLWFWGNGILKDPLSIYGLGILVYNIYASEGNLVKRILFVAFGYIILINTKGYIFSAFAIAALLSFGITKLKGLPFIGKIAAIVAFLGLIGVFYGTISQYIFEGFSEIMTTSQFFIEAYESTASEGTGTLITTFNPSPSGFVILALQGLVNVFLRPFPWELRKIVYLFSILENLLVYYIIFHKLKLAENRLSKASGLFKNFSISFFIILGVIVGVTAFNLGTISRYRVPALPFMFAGLFAGKIVRGNTRRDLGLVDIPKME